MPLGDPFAFYAALRREVRTCFLLESAPGPKRLAEYTFIGFEPQYVFALRGGRLVIDGKDHGPLDDPLGFLREVLGSCRPAVEARFPKYLGGLVGYVGYDFVRYLEPRLSASRRPEGPAHFPDFELGLYLDGIIHDHLHKRAFYFSWGEDRFGFIEGLLRDQEGFSEETLRVGPLEADLSRGEFIEGVERALEAVYQGEVFQLVLSRALSASYRGDLFEFYRRIREINPSPYMYCLEFERGTGDERLIAGSSPEMLVSVQGQSVITYPIAGTRPLGRDEAEKKRYREELLGDEKERAEHVMLVDLARNDIGRVSEFGSVRVPQYMTIERFSHVQHIVSRVEGRLRRGLDAFDAFAALFPAGTVTGAPKIRAMEWIDRLEESPRGPYAGVVGYFSLTGDMDTAIAIRTLFAAHNTLHLRAGAGIVADSLPEREWEETEQKLKALLSALEGGSP